MAETATVSTIMRDWRPVALTGFVVFAAALASFSTVLPAGTATGAVIAALACAMPSMVFAGVYLAFRMRLNFRRMKTALDNMSQGLCVFDRHERLVVCNKRFIDMYKLTPEIVKPGVSLAGLLEFRIANGTFATTRKLTDANCCELAARQRGRV